MLRAMSTRWKLVVASALTSFAFTGCAYGELHQVLRAQVASELSCPEVAVKKKGLAYLADEEELNRYLVTGCGVTRTYTCPDDPGLVSYDEPICTFEEGNTDQPEVAEMPAEPGAGDNMFDDESDADTEGDAEEAPAKPDKAAAKKKAPAKKPAKADDDADDDEEDDEGDDETD